MRSGPILDRIQPMTDTAFEIAGLRARLAATEAELATAKAELTGARILIEQYKAQLAKLRRMQFGQSSEKLDAQIAQLEMMLEDLEEGEAARTAAQAPKADQTKPPERERRQPVRKPLPDHLPREEIIHAAGEAFPRCGGPHFCQRWGESSVAREKMTARLSVVRH